MSRSAVIDLFQISRYDLPASRELSFPPLAMFRDSYGEATYRDHVSQSNGDPIPCSLSLDVKLPDIAHSGIRHRRLPAHERHYLAALETEIRAKGQLFDTDRHVVEVHVDFCSSSLEPDYLGRLGLLLEQYFTICPQAVRVVTLPSQLATPRLLVALGERRFNRLKLACRERLPQPIEFAGLIAVARTAGFKRIDIELCYGRREQPATDFLASLAALTQSQPEKISLTGHAAASAEGHAGELLLEAVDLLENTGYWNALGKCFTRDQQIHYSDACGFCSTDKVGLGLAALSWTGDSYCQNEHRLSLYQRGLASGRLPVQSGIALGNEAVVRREVVKSLLCSGKIDLNSLETRYGIVFLQAFPEEGKALAAMATDGLLDISEKAVQLRPAGRLMVDAVIRIFDGHLRSNVTYLAQRQRPKTQVPVPIP